MKRSAGSLNDRSEMEKDDGASDAVLIPETEMKRVVPRDLKERFGTLAEQRAVMHARIAAKRKEKLKFIVPERFRKGRCCNR